MIARNELQEGRGGPGLAEGSSRPIIAPEVLDANRKVTGEPSSRLDVFLPEGGRALADVVATIAAAGAGVASIVTLPGRDGRRAAVVRVRTINPGPAVRRLEARGYAVRSRWRA